MPYLEVAPQQALTLGVKQLLVGSDRLWDWLLGILYYLQERSAGGRGRVSSDL